MLAPRLHGLKPTTPDHPGELHFATINLFKVIKHANTFPGKNKYPKLKGWPLDEAGRKEADSFLMALGRLEDTCWKIERVAELLNDARQKFVEFGPETTTVEAIAAFQQAHRDFPLYLDTLLIYLRIFAESLANMTSQIPGYKKNQVPAEGYREQKDWFLNQKRNTDPEYADILEHQTNWFKTLAGEKRGEGLRNLIVHKVVRTQLFIRPGETPDKNLVHAFLYGGPGVQSVSLVPAIQTIVKELFLFLDSYVDHFVPRIENAVGTTIDEYHTPSFSLLFQFPEALPSAWLYPPLTDAVTAEIETNTVQADRSCPGS